MNFVETDVTFRITKVALDHVLATIGDLPAETGGMLGGSRLDGSVRHFVFDYHAETSRLTYTPNDRFLNELLRREWNPSGINVLGFVHSHPAGFIRPSGPDLAYAQRFFDVIPEIDVFYLPIVQTRPDTGEPALYPYAAIRTPIGPVLVECELEIVSESVPFESGDPEVFQRVQDAYDIELMNQSRVIVFGAGGAAQWCEDMVRAGIAELVLVDPDCVEAKNVGTQQVAYNSVGRFKVDALRRRLSSVNPAARIVVVRGHDHDFGERAFHRLATSALPGRREPRVSLVCGFTDSFAAQARIARRALIHGLPAIAAQVYERGVGSEVTFAVPGLTPACQRCVLSARYRAVESNPAELEKVGSNGTPIWATTRLNALKGDIATAIIHAADPTPSDAPAASSWRHYFAGIAHRNLVIVRNRPEFESVLGFNPFEPWAASVHGQARLHSADTIWSPQQPDHPDYGHEQCPDCGGTGDLMSSISWAQLT